MSEALQTRAYRVKDVAEALSLSLSTVYDLVRRGEIRSIRIGRGRRKLTLIPREALDEFLRRE